MLLVTKQDWPEMRMANGKELCPARPVLPSALKETLQIEGPRNYGRIIKDEQPVMIGLPLAMLVYPRIFPNVNSILFVLIKGDSGFNGLSRL